MDLSPQEQLTSDCNTDANLIETLVIGLSHAIQASSEELSSQQSTDLSTEIQTMTPSADDAHMNEALGDLNIAILATKPALNHGNQQLAMGGVVQHVTNTPDENLQQGVAEVTQIEVETQYPDTERVANTTEAHNTCVEATGTDNINLIIHCRQPTTISSQGKSKRKKGKENWLSFSIVLEEPQIKQLDELSPDIPIDSTELDCDGKRISVSVIDLDNPLIIGRGQFGVVYAVNISERCEIPMAVKCMTREKDEHGFSSADTELATLKTVGTGGNPHVLEYYGVMINRATNELCIWMEWMNATVADFNQTRISLGETGFDKLDFLLRRVTHNITSGLWFLEMKGILHRDVKPANMLINWTAQIKLCDFGICCSISEYTILTGSPAYLPPIYENCATQNDMWALGISLLEIINGKNPFIEWNAKEIAFRILEWEPAIPTTISEHMHQLISHLLKKTAQERPRSYTDILDQLSNCNVIWTPSNDEYAFVRRVIENIIPIPNQRNEFVLFS